ncbi:MAG TPA: OmpA family protein [candidate division Zixibacteria bacterium]|nr:OmpA family protein [candidate division Zixibacteria bacterium]
MKRVIIILLVVLFSASVGAVEHRFYLGAQGGVIRIDGGDEGLFPYQSDMGFMLGYRIDDHWSAELGLGFNSIYNDTTYGSSLQFGIDKNHADRVYKVTRVYVTVGRLLFNPVNKFNLRLAGGGGLALWKVKDAEADTLIRVMGTREQLVDYQASEVMASIQAQLKYRLSNRFDFGWNFQYDYLTGLGVEFAPETKSRRHRTILSSMISLTFSFGRRSEWRSSTNWAARPVSWEQPVKVDEDDSDGDGVPNGRDDCPDTRAGVIVDRRGCPIDLDMDGIPDGLDDCPQTDLKARGAVDIHGCPVDSDYDGVPDYRDNCPFNPVGAAVDASGCPLDSDGDGVPDGLDDCPNSLFGIKVDHNGCIDLSMLDKPMVLNIDYVPGSFEVDPHNRERLKELARLLVFVSDVKLEISGYTDNIGTATANKQLSEKRARRVRDYLVSLGVETDRIKVFGKGEVDFVASNQTAAGRAQNRRVEIVFYR